MTVFRPLLNTNRRSTNKINTNLKEIKKESSVFLDRWNSIAAKYGFHTVRKVFPQLQVRLPVLKKMMGDFDTPEFEEYWDNVEQTMKAYTGKTFVKYFTLEYATRETTRSCNVTNLMNGAINNFPMEEDKEATQKALCAIRESIRVLGRKSSTVSDKLEIIDRGKFPKKVRKLEKQLCRYTREVVALRKQIMQLESGE